MDYCNWNIALIVDGNKLSIKLVAMVECIEKFNTRISFTNSEQTTTGFEKYRRPLTAMKGKALKRVDI